MLHSHPQPQGQGDRLRPHGPRWTRLSTSSPFAFLFLALLMAFQACLADPAGMDSCGDMASETEPFIVIRGPNGSMIVQRGVGDPLADGDDEDDDFTCEDVEDCWKQCMRLDGE